jgi:clan AA aspartic protease (TIGR02281 family)
MQIVLNSVAFAQSKQAVTWKECQSPDVDVRLRGCTAVINANGYGSQSKLADALDGRCWAYHDKEQFNLAIQDCKASIRIRPRYSYAYNNLGTAYVGLGDYRNAVAAFNTSIELKPDFYWSRFNRAGALVALGDIRSAAKDYEYLLSRDPSNEDLKNKLYQLRAPIAQSTSGVSISIPMKNDGGIFVIPVEINGAITLDFIVDSGASDVSIPADVVSTLIRTGTIQDSDFIGTQTYVLADGSTAPSHVFLIRSLKLGDHIVRNVRGSIASPRAALLLGQSFLQNFKSWSIDNTKHVLLLE